jgi:radical SAM protein with 4Fe4S-binding SPASM domain
VFLLHKPVGQGQEGNVLKYDDPRLKEFFTLIDQGDYPFKIGFDSCTVPGLINFTSNVSSNSLDTCEGGRWSAYITSDMKMLPCSFDNQELRWAYDISHDTIQNAWDSKQFENFRNHFRNSCSGCERQCECRGGCPIRRQIVLCERKEKKLQ